MTLAIATHRLLAGADWTAKLKEFSRGFTDQSGESNVAGIVLTACGLCVLVLLLDRLLRTRRPRRRERLVDHLAHCAALLTLDPGELRDLRTLAGRVSLAHPAAMLLSPANLAHAMRSAGDDPRLRERVNALSVKVFGTELPSVTKADS